MSILSRQLGDPYASRAVLEFAEHHDVLRSGRLYSETVLTMLESVSREDAEAVAWRAAKKGYLLTAMARANLEKSGSYTSAQWRAHWRLQDLKEDNTIEQKLGPHLTRRPSHIRGLYAVLTRRRGRSLEVLSLKGQAAPFHSFDNSKHPINRASPPSDGIMPKTATEETDPNATASAKPLERPWSGRASKVWFVKGQEVLCFVRSDSRPGKPQLDTFGGNMEEADEMSFAACARRELNEEVRLERSWLNAAEHAYETSPNGHAHYTLHCTLQLGRYQGKTVLVTHWFVSIPSSSKPVELTEEGRRESTVGTLSWRTAKVVFENLRQFDFLKPFAQDFLGLVSVCGDKAGRFSQVAALPAWIGGDRCVGSGKASHWSRYLRALSARHWKYGRRQQGLPELCAETLLRLFSVDHARAMPRRLRR